MLTPVVAGVAAILLWGTVAGSHTNPTLDRVHQLDRTGVLLPNWRFFAPEPGRHDHHVLYRTIGESGPTPWDEVWPITPRRWLHTAWFPGRRREKGLFDISVQIVRLVEQVEVRHLPRTAPYRTLAGFVAERVRAGCAGAALPERFQFALVKFSGLDDTEEPEYVLVSPWEPVLRPAAG